MRNEGGFIGVVGPCSAGKSTLIAGLNQYGYLARHIAQEHSYVQDMWQRLANPRLLVFLDVSYRVSMQRRPLDLSEVEFAEQNKRLKHARRHADFYIHTDDLTPQDVLQQVAQFLSRHEQLAKSE
jgi:dephospho-CoA kinase